MSGVSWSWWNKKRMWGEKKIILVLLPKKRHRPRERLDDRQNRETKTPDGSTLETEIPGLGALERGAFQVSVTAVCRATHSSKSLFGRGWFRRKKKHKSICALAT